MENRDFAYKLVITLKKKPLMKSDLLSQIQEDKQDELEDLKDFKRLNRATVKYFKERQEKLKAEEAKSLGIPNTYKFNVDDLNYTAYDISDLRIRDYPPGCLLPLEIGSEIETVSNIKGLLSYPVLVAERNTLSREIQEFITQNCENEWALNMKKQKIIPQQDQMILVRWPYWRDVLDVLHSTKLTSEVQRLLSERWYKKSYTDNEEKKYQGKWYRACFDRFLAGTDRLKPRLCWVELVDIGKKIVVPYEDVYLTTCRFMLPVQFMCRLSLLLFTEPNLQYSPEVHKKFAFVLKTGMKINVAPVCNTRDGICVCLIDPTEEWCNEQYENYLKECEENEISKQRERIEKKLMRLISEYSDFADDDIYIKVLQHLKDEYIEEKEKEEQEKGVLASGLVSRNKRRTIGGYSKCEFKVVMEHGQVICLT